MVFMQLMDIGVVLANFPFLCCVSVTDSFATPPYHGSQAIAYELEICPRYYLICCCYSIDPR